MANKDTSFFMLQVKQVVLSPRHSSWGSTMIPGAACDAAQQGESTDPLQTAEGVLVQWAEY